MNTFITRRQMLAATAGSLIVPVTANTIPLSKERPRIIRQIAEWNVFALHLKCWCEGLAEDVPLAIDDARSVWSDRAPDPTLEFHDLESLLFKNHKQQGLPLVRVGCATDSNLIEAAETAYVRAGRSRLRDTGKHEYGGWVLVSAPEHLLPDSRSGIRYWTLNHLPFNTYFDTEALVDQGLASGSVRVTALIT